MRCLMPAVMVLAAFSAPALACSWEGVSLWNVSKVLPSRFSEADAIVRARVESVKVRKLDPLISGDTVTVRLPEHVATLVVLEAFKGDARRMEVSGESSMCGYQFKVGEEMIYFISNGSVGIPNVEPVSSWLISALAAQRSAATPNKSLERTRD